MLSVNKVGIQLRAFDGRAVVCNRWLLKHKNFKGKKGDMDLGKRNPSMAEN